MLCLSLKTGGFAALTTSSKSYGVQQHAARDREHPYRHAIRKCDGNVGSTKQAEGDRTDPIEECAEG